MSHTPGPWKVEKRGADGIGYPITEPVSVGAFPWLVNVPAPPFALGAVGALVCYENGEANARLMAAAPDLLEACAKAEAGISDWRLGAQHKDHDDYRHMTAAEPYLRSVLDSLHAAIRKAEGR